MIDTVLIKEAQKSKKDIWSFDMREIDPLKEDEDDEEDPLLLHDKDVCTGKNREIGAFILHEDFNEGNPDYNISIEEKEIHSQLS